MNQVTRAATPEELARVEARRQKQVEADAKASMAPPTFVEGLVRHLTVPLDYPVVYSGQQIAEVVIRRPTMREWRAYIRECTDAVTDHGPGADDLVDQVWLSVPAIVLENLDFVDASRVESAQEGFFARSTSSLNSATEEETGEGEPSDSSSETGEDLPSS